MGPTLLFESKPLFGAATVSFNLGGLNLTIAPENEQFRRKIKNKPTHVTGLHLSGSAV